MMVEMVVWVMIQLSQEKSKSSVQEEVVLLQVLMVIMG
jgi:hypothetical protein